MKFRPILCVMLLIAAFALSGCDDSGSEDMTSIVPFNGPLYHADVIVDGVVIGNTGSSGIIEADLSGYDMPVIMYTKGGTLNKDAVLLGDGSVSDTDLYRGVLKAVVVDPSVENVNLSVFTTLATEMLWLRFPSEPEAAAVALEAAYDKIHLLAAQFGLGMGDVDFNKADALKDPTYATAQTVLIAALVGGSLKDYNGSGISKALYDLGQHLGKGSVDDAVKDARFFKGLAIAEKDAAHSGLCDAFASLVLDPNGSDSFGVRRAITEKFGIEDSAIPNIARQEAADLEAECTHEVGEIKMGFVEDGTTWWFEEFMLPAGMPSPEVALSVQNKLGEGADTFIRLVINGETVTGDESDGFDLAVDGKLKKVFDLDGLSAGEVITAEVTAQYRDSEGSALSDRKRVYTGKFVEDGEPSGMALQVVKGQNAADGVEYITPQCPSLPVYVFAESDDFYSATFALIARVFGPTYSKGTISHDDYKVNFIAPEGSSFYIDSDSDVDKAYGNYMVPLDTPYVANADLRFDKRLGWDGNEFTIKAEIRKVLGENKTAPLTPAVDQTYRFIAVEDADKPLEVRLTKNGKDFITLDDLYIPDPESDWDSNLAYIGELKAEVTTWRSKLSDKYVSPSSCGVESMKILTDAPSIDGHQYGFLNTFFPETSVNVDPDESNHSVKYIYPVFGNDVPLNSKAVHKLSVEIYDGDVKVPSVPLIIKFRSDSPAGN